MTVFSRFYFFRILYLSTLELPRWLSGKGPICQCRRHQFKPWVGKIPWRKKWQPSPVFLPGKSHGQRSLADYRPRSHKRVGQDLIINIHKRQLYTWASPDGQYQSQIDSILCSWRWRSSIQSAKTIPGADYGSDHELLTAKFRLKLKKVGKTTRPFRYDLNQIPYDHTVEMTNRFKGLDLIECLKNYGWRFVTLYRRQGSRTSPRKRNPKRKNGCLRRPYK